MNKTKKGKKTGKIIIDVILYIFLAFALFVTILAISANTNGDGISYIGKTAFMPVASDSMEPEFYEGDIIIVKKLSTDEINALQVGDIITFYDENIGAFNTHRIVDITYREDGTFKYCNTKGDNMTTNATVDQFDRYSSDIRCKYNGTRIPKLGSFLLFLKTKTGFGLCILLPMIALFIYEIVNVILAYLQVKNKDKKTISASEEEAIKKAAVEEYLKQQADSSKDGDDKT